MDSAVVSEFDMLAPDRDCLVSVGVFDGVHLGHRRLLSRLVELARASSYCSIVITFTENPKALLNGRNHTLYLADLQERIGIIKGLGVDLIAAIRPDRTLFETTAEQFVGYLLQGARMKGMVVGPDFALGKGREGNIDKLKKMGQEKGFFVEVVPHVLLDGDIVSSTAIRKALAQGDLARANALLGRPFSLRGIVGEGTGKGTQIGFPTANLTIDERYALPADGVYCTRAFVDNQALLSVANIGFCPTLKGNVRTVEVHILDFKGDLYRKEMRIEVLARLRPEQKFESAAQLCDQITRDIAKARILENDEPASF